MLEFLDKLRAKPLHVRKQIAIASTVFFSLIILAVWWGSLGVATAPNTKNGVKEKSPVAVVSDAMSGITGTMVSGWSDAKGQLQYAAEHPEVLAAVAAVSTSSRATATDVPQEVQ